MDELLAKHMLQRAFATGQVQRASLPRGLCVALRSDGAQLAVTISRLHGRVRDAEIQDVRIGLGIPAAATRIPVGLSNQARRQEGSSIRYYVAFRYVCAAPETVHVAGAQVVTVAQPQRRVPRSVAQLEQEDRQHADAAGGNGITRQGRE